MNTSISLEWRNAMRAAECIAERIGHRFIGWRKGAKGRYATRCAHCGCVAHLKAPEPVLYFGEVKADLRCKARRRAEREYKLLPDREWPKNVVFSNRHVRINPLLPAVADRVRSNGHVLAPWKLHSNQTIPIAHCHCLACQKSVIVDAAASGDQQVLGAAIRSHCEAA